ncbi:MAG: tRNA 4-thiouridine(8) synthase ThiI [Desulfobacterales bacterium]
MRPVRALGLCSGGLDSILSALVLKQQGIGVAWITFITPFFSADKARQAARQTGIALTVQDITETYLNMLRNPRAGYGQHMNPCMDCHTLMFRLAGQVMEAEGFDFLFSGEVLGQRPMSQTRPSLRYVEKHSGLDGHILRPLSAKRLPETLPEQRGLVDRRRLLDFTGRGRKAQIRLAAEFGIKTYPAPAGGCLLTDKNYSRRLRDLLAQEAQPAVRALHLLRYGRHFRVDPGTKIIIGRNSEENQTILEYVDPQVDTTFKVVDFPGPLALLSEGASGPGRQLAAALCAGYSKAPAEHPVKVSVQSPQGQSALTVFPIPPEELHHLLV